MTPAKRRLLCKDGVVQPGCEEAFKAICCEEGESLRVIQERLIEEDPETWRGLLDQLPPKSHSWEEEGRISLITASYRLGNGEIYEG